MSESLAELIARRLAEMGQRRGGEPVSLYAAWEILPPKQDGSAMVSYETIRRVSKGEHTNIKDDAVDALAMMLGVPVDDVLTAAGQRIRLGRFTLPRRADKLEKKERQVVIAVVDAILHAAEWKEGTEHGDSSDEKSGDRVQVIDEPGPEFNSPPEDPEVEDQGARRKGRGEDRP